MILSIRKQSGENTVAVVDAVEARARRGPEAAAAGLQLDVVRDNSASIRTSVDAVKEHLVLGALFAALVVLLFLGNVRSTLIAALAIPVSIIGTFALMWAMGFTLNIITLLALALAVGIVIDDAIVVLENIVSLHRGEEAEALRRRRSLATQDIGLAVLATTLSLMAVFMPVAFMSGIVGRFLTSFGLTMAFAIAVSLLVSFSLTPMLAARWLDSRKWRRTGDSKRSVARARVVDRFYQPIEQRLHGGAALGDAPPLGRGLACLGALGSCSRLFKADAQGLPAQERRGPVRDQRARARGHQPPVHRASSPSASPGEVREPSPDVALTPWSPSATTTSGPPTWPTSSCASPIPTSAARARTRSQDRMRKEIVAKQPQGPTHRCLRRRRPSRRRQVHRGGQYTITGPDLDKLGADVAARRSTRPQEDAGRGRRRHEPHRRQARGAGRDRSRAGRRSRGPGGRHRRRAAAAGRRAQGLDLRGGRQRLRRPRARRRRYRSDADGLALLTVPSSHGTAGAAAGRGAPSSRPPAPRRSTASTASAR